MTKPADGRSAWLERLPGIAVLISVLLAAAFRILPGYHAVFTAHGIIFQEPDAWFHMRIIHNLMAHFPRRSGFDPYALFPGGENILAGPFWDYIAGSIAWIAGAGSPSEYLVDEVGAWLPAILGALLPIPVFFLARRLFDRGTAMLSAVWVAIIPGTFLWVGHLGMPDHHAAEIFLGFLALTILCAASEMQVRQRCILAALSGAILAAYLETQVTGIYTPAVFTVAAIFEPALASVSAMALGTACLLLLPAGGLSPWLEYRWLALIAGLAITVPLAILQQIGRKRNWPRLVLYEATAVVSLMAIGCVELSAPTRVHALIQAIRSYRTGLPGTGLASQVTELQPLWSAPPGGFGSLFREFGAAWIFAIPGFGVLIGKACRYRRPAVVLFTAWSLMMIYGAVLHIRMTAYAGLAVAIMAGITTAWLVCRIPDRVVWLRLLTAGILLLAAMSVTIPIGFAETHGTQGPDPDWWAALNWMRWNTPEPMGDPLAWYRFWPRLEPGTRIASANSAYGVIALWDKGWWISGVARRIPIANGGENGAAETSRFLAETYPENGLRNVRMQGAKYIVVGPGSITFNLPSLVAIAGRQIEEYSRVFYVAASGGRRIPARVYLPNFFRSTAARLYLFDGHRVDTATHGVHVFLTTPILSSAGHYEETIQSVRNFASEKEAEQWMALHPNETATLASPDPAASCVDLDEIPWITRVFVSRDERVAAGKQPSVVKIFEITGARR